MNIDDVRIAPGTLVAVTGAEIDSLESRLWITFPAGYREYMTRLGEGLLGTFIRIYPPWRIENELTEWRRRIDKYWFWDDGCEILPKARALECVIVGDTLNGDELAFHPARSNHLFVLPRDSEQVFVAGNDLLAAVEWMATSGELTEPPDELEFEGFDSRLESAEDGEPDSEMIDAEGESLDDVVALGKRWAERNSLRKLADQDLKKQVGDLERQFGSKRTSTFLYDALVLDGEFPYEPGYIAVFQINDQATKLEVGTATWHKSEHTSGVGYVPNQANLAKLANSK